MSILENHLAFVNENIDFQERTIGKLGTSPSKQKFHQELLAKYLALHNYLIEQDKKLNDAPASVSKRTRLSITRQDLEGLPDELLKQLSISDGDKTDFAVLNILEEYGGVASLDQILIGVYKKTGEVLKRQNVTSRMYRMSQRDLIWSVPGKKGVYSNRPISEQEAAKLFGEESADA